MFQLSRLHGITPSMFIFLFLLYENVSGSTMEIIFNALTPNYGNSRRQNNPLQPVMDVVQQRIREAYPNLGANFLLNAISYGEKNFTCFDDVGVLMDPLYRLYYEEPLNFTDSSQSFTVSFLLSCNQELNAVAAAFCREINQTLLMSGPDSDLSNKTVYPTTINLNASPDSAYFRALHGLAARYGWHQIAYICDPPPPLHEEKGQENFPEILCGRVDDIVRDLPVQYTMNQVFLLTSATSDGPDYNSVFTDDWVTGSRAILVLLSSDRLRNFMLKAASRGMTNGEHVFLTMQHMKPGGVPVVDWRANDAGDPVASKAFESLLVIQEVGTNLDSDEIREFLVDVDHESISKYNWPTRPYVTGTGAAIRLVDSIFMAAQAINRSYPDLPGMDAKSFVQRTLNNSYRVLSTELFIDTTGSLIVPIPVLRFSDSAKLWQAAYVCHPLSFVVGFKSNVKDMPWFGKPRLPPEIPRCGLHNDKCFRERPEMQYVPATVATFITIAIGLSFHFIRKYYLIRRYRHLYLDSWSVVEFPLLDPTNSRYDVRKPDIVETEITFGEVKAQAMLLHSFPGSSAIFITQTTKNIPFWRATLTIHDMHHRNLIKFYGVTFLKATGQIFCVSEYCDNGSLRTLISSKTLLSDIQFRLSFIWDIILGLHFIHKSAIAYHGNLSIFSCQVDRRFTVKICQTGYKQMLDKLLKRTKRKKAHHAIVQHQTADVKHFGEILQTLISQVSGENHETPQFSLPEILDKLEFAVSSCQQDSDWLRPKTLDLLQLIKQFAKTECSLIERLMNKVTQRAESLQSVVAERTKALVEETGKVDALLGEILPQSIITKLRNQQAIEAELFESATVLFSDIPIFFDLVRECSPMVLVEFLNAVYSTFDVVLGKFDAYKVETINDSYMVVSGIPTRNRTKHAAEICALALELQWVGQSVKIASGPEIKVKLRIGINTGPVATGVVGKRLPRYCLFGDAINTASRMESHGQPDKIHVGEPTVSLINIDQPGRFSFDPRGLVEIKGKGEIPTYWLTGSATTGTTVTIGSLNFDRLIELTSKDT